MVNTITNMATKYTKEWTDFFTGSGIPVDVASSYALIFYENRIQKNMLLDLNKEYLKDMGITVMGDVIAILKHAKFIHKKLMNDQTLIEQSKDTIPADGQNKIIRATKNLVIKPEVRSNIQLPDSLSGKWKTFQELLANSDIDINELGNTKMKILLNNMASKDSNQRKLGKVLPKKESGYKIKLSKGITEVSKTIVDQTKKREIKTTVFERLGESSVSSTTSESLPGNSASSNLTSSLTAQNKDKNQSVFARLGLKTVSAVSSTSSLDCGDAITKEQLPYVGILKSGTFNKKTTMRADDEQQKTIRHKSELSNESSVKKRLSVILKESPNKVKTISSQKSVEVGGATNFGLNSVGNGRKGVKSRLNGTKSIEKLGNTKSSSTQNERLEVIRNKRKTSLNQVTVESSPSKRVRFGSTTLRLIPPFEGGPGAKNCLNLGRTMTAKMMIVKNEAERPVNITSGRGLILDRLGKRRIERLPEMTAAKRTCSIRDRLG